MAASIKDRLGAAGLGGAMLGMAWLGGARQGKVSIVSVILGYDALFSHKEVARHGNTVSFKKREYC